MESEQIGLNFESAAKIVENYENPQFQDGKRLERGTHDLSAMDGARRLAQDMAGRVIAEITLRLAPEERMTIKSRISGVIIYSLRR